MKPALWIIIAGLLILIFIVLMSRRPSNDLDVEPHAAEEIEKAERR